MDLTDDVPRYERKYLSIERVAFLVKTAPASEIGPRGKLLAAGALEFMRFAGKQHTLISGSMEIDEHEVWHERHDSWAEYQACPYKVIHPVPLIEHRAVCWMVRDGQPHLGEQITTDLRTHIVVMVPAPMTLGDFQPGKLYNDTVT